MAGDHNKVLFAGASRKLIDFRNFCRQGFFHEHVFASLEDMLGEGEATSPGRDQIDTSIVVDLSIGTSRNRWSSRIGV